MSISELTGNNVFWSASLIGDLQRFLMSRLKCPETAADLTHETYLRLDTKIKNNYPDNPRALAFHIAANLAIDYQRKVAIRSRHASTTDLDEILESVSDLSSQPDRTLIAQQQLAVLKQALDALPVNCRTAFYLHSAEGLSYSEIAAHMGISKSMVNKLLSQAMTHCTLLLEK